MNVMHCFVLFIVYSGLTCFGGCPLHGQDDSPPPIDTTQQPADDKEPAEENPTDAQPDKEEESEGQTEASSDNEAKGAETEAVEPEEDESASGSNLQAGTRARVILDGLHNPTGLAIQPETGTVFLADSGNHQIVKLVEGEAEPVITDFPDDAYGEDPKVNFGPLGLLFLDKKTLVVGGGGLPDGEELLRVYELPEDGTAIKADQLQATFTLPAEDGTEDSEGVSGEGDFFSLAATPDAVYVTCHGDDSQGWIARATREGNQLKDFQRFIATKEATGIDSAGGITISPEGYLVVGQMGETDDSDDSLLTFYDILGGDGEILEPILETGLRDICAIAYGPGRPNSQMYVLDCSWADASQGGLFQILNAPDSETGMRAVRLMTLARPTAMAFNADGDLFITVLGESDQKQDDEEDEGEADATGQLILVTKEAGL